MELDPISHPQVQAIGESGCWIWTGDQNGDGYGRVYLGGGRKSKKTALAHRENYRAVHGSIPAGKSVCHRCDTPSCVNPDHLWLGSHEQNMHDRNRKGRASGGRLSGEHNPAATLTDDRVKEIFYAVGTITEIAKRYGLARSHVCRIKRRQTRQHITEHLAAP